MQRKTTRYMVGNPSVEYMNGFQSWCRGQELIDNPYTYDETRHGLLYPADPVAARRWTRGWNYAEAHKA